MRVRAPSNPKSPFFDPAIPPSGLRLIVLAFCAGLLALMWVWVAYQVSFERDYAVERRESENDNLARLFEEHVQRTLAAPGIALKQLEAEYRQHGERLDLARYLRDRRDELMPYSVLSVVDEDGNLILASIPFVKPQNFRNVENFQFHMRNASPDVFIAKPRSGTVTRRPTIYLTRRMNKADGTFGGYTLVGVDPQYFSSFYDEIDLGADSTVVLIGRDGVIRARRSNATSSEEQIGRYVGGSALFSVHLKQAEHGRFRSTGLVDGVKRLVSFRSVKAYPLVVLVGVSEAAALASVRARKSNYVWWASGMTVVILLFGILLDAQISRQARTNQLLREGEARLAEAQTIAALGSWEWYIDTDADIWSEALYRIFGRDPKLPAPTYKERRQLYAPESWARLKAAVKETLRSTAPYELDLEFLRPDGTRGWIAARGEAVRDATGRVTRLRGTAQDITERKRAEQIALKQFKLAETFFNQSVSCLVVLDRNFNFLRVNEAFARACRRDVGEFAGRNHFDLYPSDAKAIFEEVVRTKAPFETYERAFVFPDQPERGMTYWEWTLVPILDGQGEVEYLVYSLNEVTERKRAQEVLEQSVRRVQALSERVMKIQQEERDRIARELHDELGQTLTALKVNLQMLEPYCADGEAEERLTEALMITGRSLDQVRGMMLDLRPLGLEDLGLTVVLKSHLAKQAEAAGWDSHFETALPGRLRPELEMACFRVVQEALTNVMRHAQAKRVWVTLELNAGEVQLSVRDDGTGFDVALVPDPSPTGAFGLIGMQERVRQIGGQLSIHSDPGRGTEVRARFPCELAGSGEPDANGPTHT